ncbi:hydrogen peroxide-inducible genes activator [Formicincola oecophyllae]|uniref:Hydrogen peroxide-inducible genes activator n=1 Tax=Formicincola oecophyllae TaxID=2558361 RepID=A0A4Y6UA41_9PROT|nr:hydrogen peroxide-inducible genes activator [Formicincola oecophyllae]QDH13448.1 hydrogen peroxide-inducible genes activator [Formicincola oecophyllae]
MSYVPLSGLSLRDVEYAVAVDDLRNFSRAAERCGVSQAGLSEQVRKLENVLGVKLFERSRRTVTPTPESEHILRHARELLATARAFLEAAHHDRAELTGTLHLGLIPTLGPYYLPDLLPLLRGRWPGLKLRLEECITPTLAAALRQGELDMGVLVKVPGLNGLHTEPLFTEPFWGVFPANHELATKAEIKLADFNRADLLLLEKGHCLRDQALSLCPGVRRHPQRLAPSLEMLWHMIGVGEGFSLIPALALRNRTDFADLVRVRRLDESEAHRLICLAWRPTDPRHKLFLELAKRLRAHVPDGCLALDQQG